MQPTLLRAEIGIQILIIFIGGSAFQVTRIGGCYWGISLALGLVSLPLGVLLRVLPSKSVERVLIKMRLSPNPEVLPTARPNTDYPAFQVVCDNLETFVRARGERVRGSSYVNRSRKARAKPVTRACLPNGIILPSCKAPPRPMTSGRISL